MDDPDLTLTQGRVWYGGSPRRDETLGSICPDSIELTGRSFDTCYEWRIAGTFSFSFSFPDSAMGMFARRSVETAILFWSTIRPRSDGT